MRILSGSTFFVSVTLLSCMVPTAQAAITTIDFENVPNEFNTRAALPVGYGDLAWAGSAQAQTYGFYNGTYTNTLSVGSAVVNAQHLVNLAQGGTVGGSLSFSSDIPFFLRSLTLTAFLSGNQVRNFTAGAVKVEGTLAGDGGALQAAEVIAFTADLVQDPDMDGIWTALPLSVFDPVTADRDDDWLQPLTQVTLSPLQLGTARGTWFLADNINIELVPAPGAGFLLAGALSAMFTARRQRQPIRQAQPGGRAGGECSTGPEGVA
jgi:hypothetical protein